MSQGTLKNYRKYDNFLECYDLFYLSVSRGLNQNKVNDDWKEVGDEWTFSDELKKRFNILEEKYSMSRYYKFNTIKNFLDLNITSDFDTINKKAEFEICEYFGEKPIKSARKQ